PGQRNRRIFLHRSAPIFIAALEIKILVILHTLLIEFAPLGGSRAHRHGPGHRLGFRGLVLGKSSRKQDKKGDQPSQDAALHHRFSLKTVILRSTTAQSVASSRVVTKVTEGLRRVGVGRNMGESKGSSRGKRGGAKVEIPNIG